MSKSSPTIDPTLRRRRLTVTEYLALLGTDAIPDGSHVELLGGYVVEQMTKYTPHNFACRRLGDLLRQLLPDCWVVSEEKSLELGPRWRPEPDIAAIRGPETNYRARDPNADDVGLLVEVAESSYALDRKRKWSRYAACRIVVYWIVNLEKRRIEVYRDPTGVGRSAEYRSAEMFEPGSSIRVMIDGVEVGRVAVDDVLP